MESQYKVVYDVLNEGVGAQRFTFLAAWLAGIVIGGFILRRARQEPGIKAVFVTLGLIGWTCVGGIGSANIFYQRLRCLAWARAGEYEVTEGPVREFVPMPVEGHA